MAHIPTFIASPLRFAGTTNMTSKTLRLPPNVNRQILLSWLQYLFTIRLALGGEFRSNQQALSRLGGGLRRPGWLFGINRRLRIAIRDKSQTFRDKSQTAYRSPKPFALPPLSNLQTFSITFVSILGNRWSRPHVLIMCELRRRVIAYLSWVNQPRIARRAGCAVLPTFADFGDASGDDGTAHSGQSARRHDPKETYSLRVLREINSNTSHPALVRAVPRRLLNNDLYLQRPFAFVGSTLLGELGKLYFGTFAETESTLKCSKSNAKSHWKQRLLR